VKIWKAIAELARSFALGAVPGLPLALVIGLGLALAPFPAAAQAPRVAFDTTAGVIVVELAPQQAPKTVANFLEYVQSGQYDNTIFHRVMAGFMIQGGGYKADLSEKPTRAPIPLESQSGLANKRGTIAMARRGEPNSATSQFFINVVDNPNLDYPKPDGHGYAVFGKVVEGMDVVDKIRAAPTAASGSHQNLPQTPIVIKSAQILK
jgi:peptidyl-prolyl cis-trans isomerase A (cyclophilin A)